MPGGDSIAARARLAESGTARRRLGDAARGASWAGGCPGPQESAGTRDRGKTCKGPRSLRRVLGPWAWGARTTPPCLGRTLRRLAGRRGTQKAALACAHTIPAVVYARLTPAAA